MLILGLLGIYFDAAVVFVTKSSLFFRLAVAILCTVDIIVHEKTNKCYNLNLLNLEFLIVQHHSSSQNFFAQEALLSLLPLNFFQLERERKISTLD